jgi:5-methylcytosine-specific restriction endonuclease McrA
VIAVGQARRHHLADGGSFTGIEVFERDEYRCYLCGGLCTGDYPAPMSPSMDHVKPISRGGHHTLENVKTAHLLCNMSKGINELGSA